MSKTLKEKFLAGEKDYPFLKSIDDCREFIQKELEGVNVRFFS